MNHSFFLCVLLPIYKRGRRFLYFLPLSFTLAVFCCTQTPPFSEPMKIRPILFFTILRSQECPWSVPVFLIFLLSPSKNLTGPFSSSPVPASDLLRRARAEVPPSSPSTCVCKFKASNLGDCGAISHALLGSGFYLFRLVARFLGTDCGCFPGA